MNKCIQNVEIDFLLKKLSSQLERLEKTKSTSKPEQQKLLSTEEAAKFLGISTRTLYSYRKLGLPNYQIGRKVIYNSDNLMEFLDEYRISKKGGSNV